MQRTADMPALFLDQLISSHHSIVDVPFDGTGAGTR
jgi:hypothetical protein